MRRLLRTIVVAPEAIVFAAVAMMVVAPAILLLRPPKAASAQTLSGWTVHRTPHFIVYIPAHERTAPSPIDSAPQTYAARLEEMYSSVLAPLALGDRVILYPLYPSVERFGEEWWRFAAISNAQMIHGWGAVAPRDAGDLQPHVLTRAVVRALYPQAIPLLRWGLGDALGDRLLGIDPQRHVRILAASGQEIPPVDVLLEPVTFGNHLPVSYPVAVAFVDLLIGRYGIGQVGAFVNEVSYRYADAPALFQRRFGTALDDVDQAWRVSWRSDPASPIDVDSYFEATRFTYEGTLTGNSAAMLVEPHGVTVLTEVFSAIRPVRALDVEAALRHVKIARRAAEQTARQESRRRLSLRGIVVALAVIPILLAVGLLLWPTLRAQLYRGT